MVTIELDEYSGEDVKLIQELQKYGLPDELIQKAYDEEMRRRKEKR